MREKCRRLALIFFLLFSLTSYCGAQETEKSTSAPGADQGEWSEFEDPFAEGKTTIEVHDPIEPFNRGMFWVNDKLYFYLFKPVARGLRVIPEPGRISLSNFFSNLTTPVRFANCLLQLKFIDATHELSRFVVNSTLGIGGLFDPATKVGKIPKKKEDFGQTLGRYGVGPGFYLVLPVLGPSNVRDTAGLAGDYYLDPWTYMADSEDWLIAKTVDKENELSLDEDTYEDIKKQALDPYLFIRNAYAQRREGQIKK